MMKKIKVVHIVTLLEFGGAQQTVLTILKNLNAERFDRVLLCGRGGFLDSVALASGFSVRFVPHLIRQIRPWRDVWALVSLWRLLRLEKPDIVHTHSSKAGVLGRLAAWGAGVPAVVHTVHGFGFTPAQPSWVRGLFVLLERFLARRTTALIFVSKANQEEALARGIGDQNQMHLIRAAVPLQTYFEVTHRRESPPGIRLAPSDKLVTTVGPFKPQKNLPDFIRVAEWVSVRHPEAKFVIVGDGTDRKSLETEIVKRGLTQHLFLLGWRQDMAAIFSRTEIFCMTSLWEGLPMALVEAMAAGLPSVVNAVDGCKDVIRDGQNGFLTPPGSPEVTAEKIIQLLEDPALAQKMGAMARKSLGRDFDTNTMVSDHEALYGSLVRQK